MSWSGTAFTPIVTYNQPPFGFHEIINPPDFKTCNENPWSTGDKLRADIQSKLKEHEYRSKLDPDQGTRAGYDLDHMTHDALYSQSGLGCECGRCAFGYEPSKHYGTGVEGFLGSSLDGQYWRIALVFGVGVGIAFVLKGCKSK